MEFRNTSAINPQRPEALVEMSSNALMADDGRVASETHLMNSLSIQIGIRSRGFDDAVGESRGGEREGREIAVSGFAGNRGTGAARSLDRADFSARKEIPPAFSDRSRLFLVEPIVAHLRSHRAAEATKRPSETRGRPFSRKIRYIEKPRGPFESRTRENGAETGLHLARETRDSSKKFSPCSRLDRGEDETARVVFKADARRLPVARYVFNTLSIVPPRQRQRDMFGHGAYMTLSLAHFRTMSSLIINSARSTATHRGRNYERARGGAEKSYIILLIMPRHYIRRRSA